MKPGLSRESPRSAGQAGAMLVEGLVAILVFSIGVLALVALQAVSIRQSGEARTRTEASMLANQLLGQMWADQAQGSGDVHARLVTYAHHPDSVVCEKGAAPSSEPAVTDWLAEVEDILPGAVATHQRVTVDGKNQVKITLCWQNLPEETWHHYQVTSLIGY